MVPKCSIYHYMRSECWCSVCVCVCGEGVTTFMKHVMSYVVSGWTDGLELTDAGWSGFNAVWLVAYRMWHWFGLKNIDLEWFLPSVDMEGCIDVHHGSHFKLISPRLCVCVCVCGVAAVPEATQVWNRATVSPLHFISHTLPISHSWQVA